MSKHYRNHANELVEKFVTELAPEVAESLDQEALDSLAMRIESALSVAVLEELESVADKLDSLSHTLRHHAEVYDD